jgi:hypothetical protein
LFKTGPETHISPMIASFHLHKLDIVIDMLRTATEKLDFLVGSISPTPGHWLTAFETQTIETKK